MLYIWVSWQHCCFKDPLHVFIEAHKKSSWHLCDRFLWKKKYNHNTEILEIARIPTPAFRFQIIISQIHLLDTRCLLLHGKDQSSLYEKWRLHSLNTGAGAASKLFAMQQSELVGPPLQVRISVSTENFLGFEQSMWTQPSCVNAEEEKVEETNFSLSKHELLPHTLRRRGCKVVFYQASHDVYLLCFVFFVFSLFYWLFTWNYYR